MPSMLPAAAPIRISCPSSWATSHRRKELCGVGMTSGGGIGAAGVEAGGGITAVGACCATVARGVAPCEQPAAIATMQPSRRTAGGRRSITITTLPPALKGPCRRAWRSNGGRSDGGPGPPTLAESPELTQPAAELGPPHPARRICRAPPEIDTLILQTLPPPSGVLFAACAMHHHAAAAKHPVGVGKVGVASSEAGGLPCRVAAPGCRRAQVAVCRPLAEVDQAAGQQ